MKSLDSANGKTHAAETAQKAKKPYSKPAFRSERVFETSALSCGKITSTQSGCGLNRKQS
jgi:hypothetical protein